MQRAITSALADGKPFDTELRITRPDGKLRYLKGKGWFSGMLLVIRSEWLV